jgi:hypothetical protein
MILMAVPFTRNFFIGYMIVGTIVDFAYGMWFSKLGQGKATLPDALAPMDAPHPEP